MKLKQINDNYCEKLNTLPFNIENQVPYSDYSYDAVNYAKMYITDDKKLYFGLWLDFYNNGDIYLLVLVNRELIRDWLNNKIETEDLVFNNITDDVYIIYENYPSVLNIEKIYTCKKNKYIRKIIYNGFDINL